MAETTKIIRSATPDQNGKMVINQMTIRMMPVDRTRKDMGKLIYAVESAESLYYPNRSELYDIYAQILMDPHLSGIIDKRISSVLNKELYYETDQNEEVVTINKLTEKKAFRDMLRELMWQKFWGLTGFEFIPGAEFAFNRIPRKHIKPNTRFITTDEFGADGFSYENVWNIWVVGEWDDLGQLLSCSPWALWKKDAAGDCAQYIELFGHPVIITKYDAFDEKTKKELDEVMRNAGSSLRLQIPNQANFEMHDGKQSNSDGALYDKFREACNKEMSIRILGATETTGSSSSSGYAQSKEHGKQQDEIIKNDMVDVLHWLNSPEFKTILKSYGYPADTGAFWYRDEVNFTEVQAKLNIATQVNKITPVGDDYIYDITGIPKPENYEALKQEHATKSKPLNKPGKTGGNNQDTSSPADLNASIKDLSLWQRFKALFQ